MWDNLILYSRSKLLQKNCPEAIELSSVCLHSSQGVYAKTLTRTGSGGLGRGHVYIIETTAACPEVTNSIVRELPSAYAHSLVPPLFTLHLSALSVVITDAF